MYIASMMMRVTKRRATAVRLAGSSLEKSLAGLLEGIERIAAKRGDGEWRAAKIAEWEAAAAKYRAMSPRQLARVVHGPWPGDGMLRAISDMTWRIVVNNTPSPFFTTDNPAFFFEGLGLSHDHAEVTFPLAPDLALIANWQGEAGATLAVAGSSRVVKEINRRIASGATRFVFSRQRATWIETLVHRRQPYLSRIIW